MLRAARLVVKRCARARKTPISIVNNANLHFALRRYARARARSLVVNCRCFQNKWREKTKRNKIRVTNFVSLEKKKFIFFTITLKRCGSRSRTLAQVL